MDFTLWDELLRQYVNDRGQVDYRRWKENARGSLSQVLQALEAVDLRAKYTREERLAYWLNLYNAHAIASVLKRYPISSIRPMFLGVPNWFSFLWFFIRRLPPNYRYSLNLIEHRILRRQFIEPRIHFALVCASVGCPLLRNQAYLPQTVYTQLEDDAHRFINNPTKVQYQPQTQTLYCSKIFKWYEQDFLKSAPALIHYINRYRHPEAAITSQAKIVYLPYDWTLNHR